MLTKTHEVINVLQSEKLYNKYGVTISNKSWYENEILEEEEYKDERNNQIYFKSWNEKGELVTDHFESGDIKIIENIIKDYQLSLDF